jgi:hypothetical protein
VSHQLIVLHGPEEPFDQHKRQFHLIGDLPSTGFPAGKEEFQD